MCFSRWACSAGRYSWSWAESWYIRTCGGGRGGEGRGGGGAHHTWRMHVHVPRWIGLSSQLEYCTYIQFRVDLVRSWNKQREGEVSESTDKRVHQSVLHLTAQTRTNHGSCITPDSPSLNKQHQLLDTSNSTSPSGSVHPHL